jgi:hypothetical protein
MYVDVEGAFAGVSNETLHAVKLHAINNAT